MDEDEALQRITRLLEQGCTMLATHHDCGAPLFRCQGEVVCPICSFGDSQGASGQVPRALAATGPLEKREEEIPGVEASVKEGTVSQGPQAGSAAAVRENDADLGAAQSQLRGILLRRLQALARNIETEQDLDRLKKQLDCMDGLLRVLRSMP